MAKDPVADNADHEDSAVMLGAFGVIAYAASMMTHEALGHGVYCMAAGGHNTGLSAWWERCSISPAGIQAAGPSVQFVGGLVGWLVLRLLPPDAARLRYVCWLSMAFDLFISSGYVAFSGVTNFGDAAVVIAKFQLQPPIAWRGVLVLVGSALYYLSMRAAALELERFAGTERGDRRLFRLVLIPYAAVGVFALSSAAMNRTLAPGVAIGLAAASSLGAGFGLVGLPGMTRRGPTERPLTGRYLTWSVPWVLAAALVVAAFLVFIGPGLQW